MAFPGDDLDTRLPGDVLGQIFVGDHDDRIDSVLGRDGFHHIDRVGRGAADIGFGFHLGRGVHIGDDGQTRIFLAQQAYVGGGNGSGERTTGIGIGDQHGLGRGEDLGRLRHEMDAGLDDHLASVLAALARQLERVADEIRHAVEDFRRHVVVRENDGVLFPLQAVDGIDIGREYRPFDLGHPMGDLGVGGLRARRPPGCVCQFRLFQPRLILFLRIYMAKKNAGTSTGSHICYA